MPSITVTLVSRRSTNATYWYARWQDPVTLKWHEKSTRKTRKKEAQRVANELAGSLNSGTYATPSIMTWEQFVTRYLKEKVATLAKNTQIDYRGVLNKVTDLVDPPRPVQLDASAISEYVALSRDEGNTDASVARELRVIKAALNWAHKMKIIPEVPHIEMPKRDPSRSRMKGRPLTDGEFNQMLEHIPSVVCKRLISKRDAATGPAAKAFSDRIELMTEHYRHLLRGYLYSGLRLEEAMIVRWDDAVPETIRIIISDGRVRLLIPAEGQKAHRDETAPVIPQFAAMVLAVPEAERTGWFFKVENQDGSRPTADTIGRRISDIGAATGIVTVRRKQPDGKIKELHPTAHDLRRTFALRLAGQGVAMPILKTVMRHASISTTASYYADFEASEAEKALDGLQISEDSMRMSVSSSRDAPDATTQGS